MNINTETTNNNQNTAKSNRLHPNCKSLTTQLNMKNQAQNYETNTNQLKIKISVKEHQI